ncbi:MAG: MBL fold metallo-hydrolase [Clostridia bacterium]|nr:MBL fold metallo-hydrolase [Clostridia bacterium]
MAKLLYQGHGSFRVTAADGTVIYIDPYAGEGYDKPCDILLVSHQHADHNQIGLVTQKPNCTVITNVEALADGKHQQFQIGAITVEAVEACNTNHDPAQCVGFILTVDGVKLYFAADTSKTKAMESFADKKLDYAFLPVDGFYNMNLEDASECAQLIGARVNVPVHMKPGELFDRSRAEAFTDPGRRIVEPGEEFNL